MRFLPDDLQDALIARLVSGWDKASGTNLGRTRLQKLAYFLVSHNVPLNVTFQMYHYGPYSQDLADALDWLEAFQVIVDRKPEGGNERVADYAPGPRAQDLMAKHVPKLSRYETTIDEVVRKLAGKKPSELELLATAHWVCASGGTNTDSNRAIREVQRIKGNKFSEGQIRNALRELNEMGWLEAIP